MIIIILHSPNIFKTIKSNNYIISIIIIPHSPNIYMTTKEILYLRVLFVQNDK